MNPNTGSLQYNVSVNTSGLAGQLNNVNNQVGNAGQQGSAAFGAKFGAVAGITSSIFSRVTDTVMGSMDAAIKRVDTLNNAPKVLQNLGYDATASEKSIKKLNDGILGMPTSLDAIVSSQVAVAAATGYSLDKVTDLTLGFNNMALAGGKGPEEAQRAFQQFSQAMSRGKFEGEEFNTMMEVMPAQMNQVAKSLLGPTASAGDLRNALSEGKITTDQFATAIVDINKNGGAGLKSFADQAKDSTQGIGTGMVNMQTAITRGVANVIEAIGSANIVGAIDAISNAISAAFKVIAGAVSFVAEHKDVFGPIAIALGVFTAAIVAANIAMGIYNGIMTAWKVAQGAWTAITTAATAAQWLFNAALTANPIGIIIVAIGALVAALVWFFTQTETGREIFSKFLDFMKGIWDAILGAITFVWNWVKDNWQTILVILTGPIGIAVGMIVKHWDTIKQAFANAWEFIKGVWSAVAGWFSNVWNGIKNAFSAVGSWFRDRFQDAWNGITNIFSNVGGWFRDRVSDIVNAFSGIGGKISGFFSGLWDKVGGGLKNVLNSVLRLPLKIPSFNIPGIGTVGGQTLIPAMAKGGIVDSPTTALIGEAGKEVVLPLENNTGWMDDLASRIGGAGPATIIVKIGEETIATKVVDLINQKSKLSGTNQIMV